MTASYWGTAEIKKAGVLSNVRGKQEKRHIWNLESRQQVLVGRRCGVCAHGSAPPSSKAPSLSCLFLPAQWCSLKTLAQSLVAICQHLAAASPSALAQAVMWIFHHLLQTKTRLCCLHDLLNLADSSWRSVPAHIVPLAALWLTGKEEINYRLGQHLPPLFAKRRIASGLRGPVTEASTGSKLPEHWFSIFH